MTVIAILNSKGGSGKSTVATNLASWFARKGEHVMLGDLDRQQSVRAWLNKRSPDLPAITTWTRDDNKVFRAPPGTTHVILDTPGALYDHQLARILVWVDAVIVPVGPSLFDVATFVPFLETLKQVPRVRSQRCAVMAVGMRWEPGKLDRWRADPSTKNIPLITVLEEHPSYPRACAQGKGIFDLPKDMVPARCLRQWEPVFSWIELQAKRQLVSRSQQTASNRAQAAPVPMGTSEAHSAKGIALTVSAAGPMPMAQALQSTRPPFPESRSAPVETVAAAPADEMHAVARQLQAAERSAVDTEEAKSWWGRIGWLARGKAPPS